MELRDISIRDAMRLVKTWHRHLDPPQGAKFALAAWQEDKCVGVALVGRKIARMEKRGTAEVLRVATDGTRNACSFLYSRAKRAAQALGFGRVVTKTLPAEGGASLRAVQAKALGKTRAQQWDRTNRRRKRTRVGEQEKIRWEL